MAAYLAKKNDTEIKVYYDRIIAANKNKMSEMYATISKIISLFYAVIEEHRS